jgi:RNA polymerase sigma factor for flagellar operon FliA
VRGAMLDELRRMDWVPRTIHEKARKIKAVMASWNKGWAARRPRRRWPRRWAFPPKEYEELLDEVRPAAFVCLDAVNSSETATAAALYEVIADTDQEARWKKFPTTN